MRMIFRFMPPGDLPGNRSQNRFCYFHGPLHGSLDIRDHVLHPVLLLPPAERTPHVLTQPDISCANDKGKLVVVPFDFRHHYR